MPGFRPLLEAIPSADTETARTQFESDGHVSMRGLFELGLLEHALQDIRSLSSARRTHNEGRRENVTNLYSPDPEKEASLYALLQGAQEGAAILGGALSLTRGCQLDLLQMNKDTHGVTQSRRKSLVGGVVANIALQGKFYYVLSEGAISEGADYFVEPGDIIFEDLARRLSHLSYTGDDDRLALTVANTIQALEDPENQPVVDTPRQNET